MTRTIAVTFVMLVLVSAMTGCYPRATVLRYGVTGRIVDAETKEPIGDAPITVTIDSIAFTLRTSSEGEFKAPSAVHWNWNRFISGPMYTSAEQATIRVVTEGYRPFRLVALAAPPLNPSDEVVAKINGSQMLLGDIDLSKEE